METLTIKVKNKERLMFLYEMLSYYDFIELPKLKKNLSNKTEHDFLKSAGLWKDKEITQETLRHKAWKKEK